MNRIKPLDGLRAFSAFGVIWIHSWSACGNPGLFIGPLNFYKIIAIVGNGVDFFFVISGFCMYLMVDKNIFNFKSYMHFLYKRLMRIAPAFFAAVVVYATFLKMGDASFPLAYNVFFHFLFLNNVVTGNTISGPFWSIGVEWHFYMVLPIIIAIGDKISILKSVILFSMLSLIFFYFTNLLSENPLWWENQILTRFPEFASGIIAAYYFIKQKKLPKIFRNNLGLCFGFLVMYFGRFLMYTPFLEKMSNLAYLFKAVSYTVMTCGFSFVMYHVITVQSLLSKVLSCRFLNYLGRISYSIYLWHSLSFILLWKYFSLINLGPLNVIIIFIAISIMSILIAHFSYKYLELFYFKKQNKFYKKTETVYAN